MMTRWRHQPPAYSPLALRSVWAGVSGVLHEPAGLRNHVARVLCEAYGANAALLVGSGTAALQLALAGVRATVSARPIALPAYCCYDVASAADGADVSALLYDIDPRTLGPDACSLQRVLEHEPAAVVAAHLYGYPADLQRLTRLCHDANVVLIEDAAQGAGGRVGQMPLGSFGSLSVLSFGRGKGTTAGAGGALLAHDSTGERALAWASRRVAAPSIGVREAALLSAQWALGRPASYGVPASIPFLHLGETIYHAPRVPTAMSTVALRALASGLSNDDPELDHRRATAAHVVAHAKRSARVETIQVIGEAEPGYLRLPLRLKEHRVADVVQLLGRFGVAAAYPGPLCTLQPFRDRIANQLDDFEGARVLSESLVTFPTHSLMHSDDVKVLEEWLAA